MLPQWGRQLPTVSEEGGIQIQMADPVAYRSLVRIERVKGSLRRAYLPAESKPVFFGVHSEIAEHYGVDPQINQPHAATLDYLVAATAG